MIVPLAPPAGRQIELQSRRVAHDRYRRIDRRLREHRAAQIGVQHRAGQVEERAQAGAIFLFQSGTRLERYGVRVGDGGSACL